MSKREDLYKKILDETADFDNKYIPEFSQAHLLEMRDLVGRTSSGYPATVDEFWLYELINQLLAAHEKIEMLEAKINVLAAQKKWSDYESTPPPHQEIMAIPGESTRSITIRKR